VIISLTPDILAADITRGSVDNVQDIAEGKSINNFLRLEQ
jgi:hypothetical protein